MKSNHGPPINQPKYFTPGDPVWQTTERFSTLGYFRVTVSVTFSQRAGIRNYK
jgi:hypothetical protein